MAFAQLTWRESLRDIEACLSAQAAKLYHMGFRQPVGARRWPMPTKRRDWRIYRRLRPAADRVRPESSMPRRAFGAGTRATRVYALDSTTIDLCLRSFPWAPFPHRPRRPSSCTRCWICAVPIPTLHPHLRWQAARCQCARHAARSRPVPFYVMDRGYLDFERLHVLHQAGAFFVTRAKSRHGCPARVFGADRARYRRHLRPDASCSMASTVGQGLPRASAAHPFQGSRVAARRWCS